MIEISKNSQLHWLVMENKYINNLKTEIHFVNDVLRSVRAAIPSANASPTDGREGERRGEEAGN